MDFNVRLGQQDWEVNHASSVIPSGEFEQDVCSSLPYAEYRRTLDVAYHDILIDDQRIIGMTMVRGICGCVLNLKNRS
jgi:hypothetical protein